MTKFKSFVLYTLLLLALIATGLSGAAWYWVERPVAMDTERVDFVVESGSRPRTIAQLMNKSGIKINEDAFVALARLTGRDTLIKAGAYEAVRGDTPRALLERMANGDMSQTQITLVEGWSYQRIRQALEQNPQVKQTLASVSDEEIAQKLAITESSLEGLFYPDTYVFVPGSSDFDILRRAYHAQQQLLASAWEERDPDLPLTKPYDALILASIVEKETGHSADRQRVAGVFINRLRLGMPLQTDPTVIYGMGDTYQGRIRKKDLTTDTPWNTYTRGGLPPTPIASAGKAALLSVLHPEAHKFLYFVSRGDGSSEFSQNLADHNRAVSKYILGRRN
ncbi:aminodeoxychorismate lyase [Pollutimonas nitritireducens]|uniref:Endolytic murein transglycosylase n=1 Tax=Pollutimonas nitritireducens TaxID=2045209 RepID=A0A2N4UGR4_9BURK|nr:endolytic transglycosylase MltG [Pollutimonas nitritireducens]PLC54200.1 aminodeoxychorismate lyase [Pollutimonas nitritireducens]